MHSTKGLSAKVLHLPETSPQTGQEFDLLVGLGLVAVRLMIEPPSMAESLQRCSKPVTDRALPQLLEAAIAPPSGLAELALPNRLKA